MRASDLPSGAKLLALTIATYFDRKRVCFVSNARLASDTSTSVATVKRFKRVLQGKSAAVTTEVWLIIDGNGGRRGSDGRGIPSMFMGVIPPGPRQSASEDEKGFTGEPAVGLAKGLTAEPVAVETGSLTSGTGSPAAGHRLTDEPQTDLEQIRRTVQPRAESIGCPCGGDGWIDDNTVCMTHFAAANGRTG